MGIWQLRHVNKSHSTKGVAFVVGLLLGIVLFVPRAELTNVVHEDNYNEAAEMLSGLSPSEPARLIIPALNLDVPFEDGLGLNPDATAQVPESYDKVGWYKYGPTPGEIGPAVILGHVDSYLGPAVFYTLGRLRAGDEIQVYRKDGSVATFVVTELQRPEQSSFPTESVYGDIDHAGLRLITCSGSYDRGVQRYSHNLIVFAKLTE